MFSDETETQNIESSQSTPDKKGFENKPKTPPTDAVTNRTPEFSSSEEMCIQSPSLLENAIYHGILKDNANSINSNRRETSYPPRKQTSKSTSRDIKISTNNEAKWLCKKTKPPNKYMTKGRPKKVLLHAKPPQDSCSLITTTEKEIKEFQLLTTMRDKMNNISQLLKSKRVNSAECIQALEKLYIILKRLDLAQVSEFPQPLHTFSVRREQLQKLFLIHATLLSEIKNHEKSNPAVEDIFSQSGSETTVSAPETMEWDNITPVIETKVQQQNLTPENITNIKTIPTTAEYNVIPNGNHPTQAYNCNPTNVPNVPTISNNAFTLAKSPSVSQVNNIKWAKLKIRIPERKEFIPIEIFEKLVPDFWNQNKIPKHMVDEVNQWD